MTSRLVTHKNIQAGARGHRRHSLVLPALMIRSFYEIFTEEVGLEFESCRMGWDCLGRDGMGTFQSKSLFTASKLRTNLIVIEPWDLIGLVHCEE